MRMRTRMRIKADCDIKKLFIHRNLWSRSDANANEFFQWISEAMK